MKTPEDHEFADLAEALFEGHLDDVGRARLNGILRDDTGRRAELRRHLALSHALGRLREGEDAFASATASHIERLASEDPDVFARQITGRILRRRIRIATALAAGITLALLPALWMMRDQQPRGGNAVAVMIHIGPDGNLPREEPVHSGQRIKLKEGMVRMTFANGAVLALESPFELTVRSDKEVILGSGRLNAWCPESAHGFRVESPSASIVDLGTSFGVAASEDGRSEVIVLDGLVEVSRDDGSLRVEKGGAVAVDGPGTLREVAFAPNPFKNTWSLNHGILATRGAIIPADPDVPERVALMEDDQHVLVIPERRSVPFNQPLRAEITGPGTIPGEFDGTVHELRPDPRKRLSSFLLRYDPVGTHPEDHFVRFEGEVTFDRPVMAIAVHRSTLEGSDPVFATGRWDSTFRGIELDQIDNDPDSVTLSEDRRTVKVTFYAGASTDEVRVILQDP